MSKLRLDPNILHAALDSGALTMLGAVVSQFPEPGDYRGTVRRGDAIERVFYLSVDQDSPVGAADVDLAKLAADLPQHQDETNDDCSPDDTRTRFEVNPRGYVLFRVSGGLGGYSVNIRRADPDEKAPVFNSAVLRDGDTFSARVLQPGRYSVTNALGEASAALSVAYPPAPFSGYRPPQPLHLDVTEQGFRPEVIEIMPAQGLIFGCHTPARIVVALEQAYERPSQRNQAS